MSRGLTPMQRAFVAAYAGNGKAAALTAGCAEKNAEVQASKWLRVPKVNEAIRARESERLAGPIAKREERQAFWSSRMRDPDEKIEARLKASELLGKSEADFTERLEVKVDDSFADVLKRARDRARKR